MGSPGPRLRFTSDLSLAIKFTANDLSDSTFDIFDSGTNGVCERRLRWRDHALSACETSESASRLTGMSSDGSGDRAATT